MRIPLMNRFWGTGGRYVAAWLHAQSIDTIFSLPGSQVLPIWDGLTNQSAVRIVVPRTERSGAFMAEGYARASGRMAVLMNTLGPGVANELPGLVSARKSHAHILCIAPYHPARKHARIAEVFQGLKHPDFFDSACIGDAVVHDAENLPRALFQAAAKCRTVGEGPVRVDIEFPILFRRVFLPYPSAQSHLVGTDAKRVCVHESPGTLQDEEGALVLAPGLGEPGAAIPVGVGAAFANPGGAVTIHTRPQHFLANADALSVAHSHGIAVHVENQAGDARVDSLGVALALATTGPASLIVIVR